MTRLFKAASMLAISMTALTAFAVTVPTLAALIPA